MDQLQGQSQAFFDGVDRFFRRTYADDAINMFLALILIAYTLFVAPNLTPANGGFLDNTFVKLLILFVILGTARYSPGVALLLTLAYVVSLMSLNRFRVPVAQMQFGGAGPMGMGPMGANGGDGFCPLSCQDLACGQPLDQTAVLPPPEDTEVSGVCGCETQGPQGLSFPPGYQGSVQGAPYVTDAPPNQFLPGA